jgi:hypothetical protein
VSRLRAAGPGSSQDSREIQERGYAALSRKDKCGDGLERWREVVLKRLNERGNSGFRGFDGRFMAKIAQSLAGDRADGSERDVGRKSEVGGFKKRTEVAGCRCAGEGDGVGVARFCSKHLLQCWNGLGRELVAVGFGDGDSRTGGGEGLGQNVAGFGSPDEKKRSAGSLRQERLGERFADVLCGDEVDSEADGISGVQGGGANGGDVFGELREVEELRPAVEGFDGVGAGEDKPVVGSKAGESSVKCGEGGGRNDLDGRDSHSGRPEGFELGGEIGRLVAGSGDEDAFIGQGWHPVGIVCLAPGCYEMRNCN